MAAVHAAFKVVDKFFLDGLADNGMVKESRRVFGNRPNLSIVSRRAGVAAKGICMSLVPFAGL